MAVDVATFASQPDLALLARFTETGDPGAFAEIVQRYARVVYSASVRILGDDARAQDVSQETFFRLMRQPRIVTHSLGGWLHRSATHLAMDARRSERSRRHREQTYVADQQSARATEPTWAEVSPYVDEALKHHSGADPQPAHSVFPEWHSSSGSGHRSEHLTCDHLAPD